VWLAALAMMLCVRGVKSVDWKVLCLLSEGEVLPIAFAQNIFAINDDHVYSMI